jgi:hypothetical protein
MHHFLPQLHINMDERQEQYDYYFYTDEPNGCKILQTARFRDMRTNTCRPVKEENASGDPTEVAAAENSAETSSSPVDLTALDLQHLKYAIQSLQEAMRNFQVCLDNWLWRSNNEPTESEDDTRHPGSPVYFPIDPNDELPPSPDYSNIN